MVEAAWTRERGGRTDGDEEDEEEEGTEEQGEEVEGGNDSRVCKEGTDEDELSDMTTAAERYRWPVSRYWRSAVEPGSGND